MKKVLSILAAASMLAVIACGPSAEEKKKAEDLGNYTIESSLKSV